MTSQHDESDATHQRSNSDYYKKGSQEEATESAVTLAKIQHVSSLPPLGTCHTLFRYIYLQRLGYWLEEDCIEEHARFS